MKEKWRQIKNYSNYLVSNKGKIFSLNTNQIMKQATSKKGYKNIMLCNKKSKFFLVHRIVAEAFLDNKNNYPEINHINTKKDDNNIYNLEWCTGEQNRSSYNKYCLENNISNFKKNRKLNKYDIFLLRYLKKIGFISDELSEIFEIGRRHVNLILAGKRYKDI